MSDYSRQERLEMERGFRLAKNHVSPTYSNGDREQFICHALRRLRGRSIISCVVHDRAKRLITERLLPYGNCVESFLDVMCIDYQSCHRDEVQKYRHRWLDALIEEFSK